MIPNKLYSANAIGDFILLLYTYRIISDCRHVSVSRHTVKRTGKSNYHKKHIKSCNYIWKLFEITTPTGRNNRERVITC